jgi:hypothetical protein
MEEEAEAKISRENKVKQQNEKYSKMIKYADLVQVTHKPKVSPLKRKEMADIMKNLEGTKRRQPIGIMNTTRSQSSRKPMDDSISKSTIKKSAYESTIPAYGESDYETEGHTYDSNKHNHINWKKFNNPMIPKQTPKRLPKVHDYLGSLRLKRDEVDREYEDLGIKKKLFSHNRQDINNQEIIDPEKYFHLFYNL